MIIVSLLCIPLFLLPETALTGTVRIECPPMYVRKVGISPNLWLADRINCTGTITFSDGTTLEIPNVIAETYVHRARGETWVDACQAIGTATDGSTLTLNLPPQQVVFTRLGVRTAVELHATGTLRTPGGRLFRIEVTYPDCPTHWKKPGLRLADAITVTGTVTFQDEGVRP